MRKLPCGLTVAAALLLLVGCGGQSPGMRSQEYMIDADIDASHGAGMPTSLNQERRGFESWRHLDPDTYGFSQGW
jgi:hypothetical protein